MIQFTAAIVYSDRSSVLLNGFSDFTSYVEVTARESTAIHLSWSYLIKFEDRDVPEKQDIELSIEGSAGRRKNSVLDESIVHGYRPGYRLRIQHTARTWAIDVENIISQQIQNWIIKESWVKKQIHLNSGWVGLVAGFLFMISTAIGLATREVKAVTV